MILQELPNDADWQQVERDWIAKARESGWLLTNGTDGGDGVPNLCPEAKAKILKTWTGRKHRPESLVKIGAASRGRTHSPEHREKMRQIMAGRTIIWGDKLSQAVRKLTTEQVRDIRCALASGALNKDWHANMAYIAQRLQTLRWGVITPTPSKARPPDAHHISSRHQ